jgi:hypothetical protein
MRRAKFGKTKTHRPTAAKKYKDWRSDGQTSYGGFSGGKTQSRPFPGAKSSFENQGPSPGFKAGANDQEPSAGHGYFAKGESDFASKSQGHDRHSGLKSKARNNQSDADIMADLFKTKEGRESLNKVDEELKKAGLGNGLERMMTQLRQTFSGEQLETVRSKAGNFFRNLKSKILTNPLSAKEDLPAEDIVFGLVLTPEAAASGTTIDISYLRDNQPHRLSVKIPAGIAERARLRLTGQGHLKPAGSRGDLLLDLSIKKP